MKRKSFLFCSSVLMALGLADVLAIGNGNTFFTTLGEDAHDWQHYSEVEATANTAGYREYWTCCGCHEVTFTRPTGRIQEGKTASSEILNYLSTSPDSRYVAKFGTIDVDTSKATNWDTVTSGPVRTEFGVSMGSHDQGTLMIMRNYQYFDWSRTETLRATYIVPGEMVSTNTIRFTYYVHQDDDSNKSDLSVTISIVDAGENTTQIDSFVIDKNINGWHDYIKQYDLITTKKIVIETKAERIDNVTNNTKLYMDTFYAKADVVEKGLVNVSTTEDTKWVWSSKETLVKVQFGVKPDGSSGGDYMRFRNYYYTGWKESQTGIEATYTIPEADIKKVNTLAFTAYMYNPSTDCNTTIKVIDVYGVEHLVVTKAYNINATTPESFTFDECAVEKIVITTKAFVQDATGEANLCLKSFTLSYAAE